MWQKDKQRKIVRNIKSRSLYQFISKRFYKKMHIKSLYRKVYIKKFILKLLTTKTFNHQNFLYILLMKYLVNRPIFHKFYMQSDIVKPCRMYFTCTFQLATFVGQLMIFMAHALIRNNFPENFNLVRSRLLFCKVLRFQRTRCFCFLHLNFIIT